MRARRTGRLTVFSVVGGALLLTGWIVVTRRPADACPEFLDRFKVTYPQTVNTKLTDYPNIYPNGSCSGLCHTGGLGAGDSLNRYGVRFFEKVLLPAMPPGTFIACGSQATINLANSLDFTQIDGEDSDGDGFTNIQEINAATYPGYSVDRPRVGDVSSTTTVIANETDPDPTSNTATVVTTVTP